MARLEEADDIVEEAEAAEKEADEVVNGNDAKDGEASEEEEGGAEEEFEIEAILDCKRGQITKVRTHPCSNPSIELRWDCLLFLGRIGIFCILERLRRGRKLLGF